MYMRNTAPTKKRKLLERAVRVPFSEQSPLERVAMFKDADGLIRANPEEALRFMTFFVTDAAKDFEERLLTSGDRLSPGTKQRLDYVFDKMARECRAVALSLSKYQGMVTELYRDKPDR